MIDLAKLEIMSLQIERFLARVLEMERVVELFVRPWGQV